MSAYITVEELGQYALAAQALSRFSTDEQLSAIEAASSEFDSYAAVRYPSLPFTTVPTAAKLHIARAAAMLLMGNRGFDPEGPDQLLVSGYKMALDFFKQVAAGKIPLVPAEVAPEASEGPTLWADTSRGIDYESV